MSEQTSVMIVDDEAPARARLRELLGDLAKEFKVEVVGEAAAGTDALVMIESLQPKVVFLDVQMPGMSGIELARHLAAHAAHGRILMPMVVFVTAFDEFAIEAFEVRAIDYLLKPVRVARLLDTLRRIGQRSVDERIEITGNAARILSPKRRHLSVHERGRVQLVPIEQVIYLKAEMKYVTIRTKEREFLIEESLTSLEDEFSDVFVRIHRNALVSKAAIAGFERVGADGAGEGSDPYWQVVLHELPDRLPVSRRQWSVVRNLVS